MLINPKVKKNIFRRLVDLLIIVVGIFISLWLNNICVQKVKDNITKDRINTMLLEQQYNFGKAKDMLKVFKNDSINTVQQGKREINLYLNHFDYTSAQSLLKDENIFKMLKFYQVSLIYSYIEVLQKTNNIIDKYNEYITEHGYRYTESEPQLKEQVFDKVISALATSWVLQEEFKVYYYNYLQYSKEFSLIDTSIKLAKDKISKEGFKLSK